MALTERQRQEVQEVLAEIDQLSAELAAETLHLADLERKQAGS